MSIKNDAVWYYFYGAQIITKYILSAAEEGTLDIERLLDIYENVNNGFAGVETPDLEEVQRVSRIVEEILRERKKSPAIGEGMVPDHTKN